jgi:hypothetical protein
MKKLALAALAATFLAAAVPAQDYSNGNSTINSGPWMMRKSTGNKTEDRCWFVMDRTLNAAEWQTLRQMFWSMPGNTDYVLMKAIVNAIDNTAKTNTDYSTYWSSGNWMDDNGLSDTQVYYAMINGLPWQERDVIYDWRNNATDTQLMAVAKLVRKGGKANAQWAASGMNTG